MSFENWQLPPVQPVPPPSSGNCDHLHIDCPPDLWQYRGRLGPRYDEATPQLLGIHDEQRRQLVAEKAIQLSAGGKGKARRLPDLPSPYYLQHPLTDPPPLPPPSCHQRPPSRAAPSGSSLPLPGPPSDFQIAVQEPRTQAEQRDQYEHVRSNGSAYLQPGHPVEQLLEHPLHWSSQSPARPEPFYPPPPPPPPPPPAESSAEPPNGITVTAGTPFSSYTRYSSEPAPGYAWPTYDGMLPPTFGSPERRGAYAHQPTSGVATTALASDGASLHAPSPRRSVDAQALLYDSAPEDPNEYPAKMRRALEESAALSVGQPGQSGAVDYELVQEYSYIDKKYPGQVVGEFNDRHTANKEAAKLFLDLFWGQITKDRLDYVVHIGEAGILTLEIHTWDSRGDRRVASVYVQRKGVWSRNDSLVASPFC
ncbi:hypothetical protein BU23DRAFT_567759 [Bimuria novae-zelandiae CBS 107.79]|uniref:Uncharacterized protein n=1 Tax=Bimuria novae-zelandiae CBS 107.79 TaxID=1447943 RepID=A0A6A5VDC9_9PLEO|nr:hypothetical protein BU23DRAFT_567759 [Bimuria novae-zelandiae CBS 107.79]